MKRIKLTDNAFNYMEVMNSHVELTNDYITLKARIDSLVIIQYLGGYSLECEHWSIYLNDKDFESIKELNIPPASRSPLLKYG